MFCKTNLVKLALVPFMAAAVLSLVPGASSSPAAIEVRDGNPPPPPQNGGNWPNKPGQDCDCDWDKDWDKGFTVKFTQPNKDTVWPVGSCQKVTWAKQQGDWKSTKRGDDGQPKPPCKAKLLLRKGEGEPFVILAKDVDVKSGSAQVTVPWVIPGDDYRVTLSFENKPEKQSNSEKFKIVKKDKDCKDGKDGDDCKGWKDGKDDKDWKDGKDGKDGH